MFMMCFIKMMLVGDDKPNRLIETDTMKRKSIGLSEGSQSPPNLNITNNTYID